METRTPSKHFLCILWILGLGVLATADVNIISKSAWNGREPANALTDLLLPVERVIIAHTASVDCSDQASCATVVRNIQTQHMSFLKFDDIAYNFLIGNDGNAYEGRGWDYQGAVAVGYNAGSVSIGFIGTYATVAPTEAALETAKMLLEKGVRLGKLSAHYKLYGHRQLAPTESPGGALYDIIKQWPQFTAN